MKESSGLQFSISGHKTDLNCMNRIGLPISSLYYQKFNMNCLGTLANTGIIFDPNIACH